MSTVTLQCDKATFISYKNRGTNYSSLTDLPTSSYFFGCIGNSSQDAESVENLKMQKGDSNYDYGGIYLSFEANEILNKCYVSSAKLHYTIKARQQGNTAEIMPDRSSNMYFGEIFVRDASQNEDPSALTYNTMWWEPYKYCYFSNAGSQGTRIFNDIESQITSGATEYSGSIEVRPTLYIEDGQRPVKND